MFLLLFPIIEILLVASLKAVTVTSTSHYTGDNTIFSVDYSPTALAFPDNSNLLGAEGATIIDTKAANITSISCYTSSDICIVGGSLAAVAVNVKEKTLVGTFTYQDDKSSTFVDMQVEALDGTSYFTVGVTTSTGIMRWNLAETEKFAKFTPNGTGIYTETTRFIRDIQYFNNTEQAAVSVFDAKGLTIFSVTKMTELTFFKDLTSGLLAYLSLDPSATLLGKAGGIDLDIINYSDGSITKGTKTDFFISGLKTVFESTYLMVSSFTTMAIYDGSAADFSVALIKHDTGQSSMGIGVSLFTGKITVVGTKLALELTLSSPSAQECHPNCDGACSIAASPSQCTSCIAGTELKDGICKKTSPLVPPGDPANLADDNWSEATEEKSKAAQSYED